MQRVIIIFILFWGINAYTQELNFREVDTSTLNRYMKEDWKGLIETGEKAIKQGIDYYYLEMRMAYAWFMLGKYRMAIPYYKNALGFNSRDHVANEFLYYSYLYSGRRNDALYREIYLSEAQKKAMNVNNIKLNSIGLSHTYGFSNASSIEDDILNGLTSFQEGVQKTTKMIQKPTLSFSHLISNFINLEHKLSYVKKNEFSYVIANKTEYVSPEQTVSQFDYSLNAQITPFEGTSISPGIHIIRTSIPLFLENSYGRNAPADRIAVSELIVKNTIYKLKVKHEFNHFTSELSWAYFDFTPLKTNQFGAHITYYPLANLNLYISTDHYLQIKNFSNETERDYILNGVIGAKIHQNLWLEANISLPGYMYLYDMSYNLAYNDLQLQHYNFGATSIIPLYKANMKIYAGYYYQSTASAYFPDNDLFNPINENNYSNHLIKLGIQWIL